MAPRAQSCWDTKPNIDGPDWCVLHICKALGRAKQTFLLVVHNLILLTMSNFLLTPFDSFYLARSPEDTTNCFHTPHISTVPNSLTIVLRTYILTTACFMRIMLNFDVAPPAIYLWKNALTQSLHHTSHHLTIFNKYPCSTTQILVLYIIINIP